MEERLENLIQKIIFKKYPSLTKVQVNDLFKLLDFSPTVLNKKYTCKFISDECLSSKEQMNIDTEVKTILKMLTPDSQIFSVDEPSISCYFDCGKGYEFKMSYGYKH